MDDFYKLKEGARDVGRYRTRVRGEAVSVCSQVYILAHVATLPRTPPSRLLIHFQTKPKRKLRCTHSPSSLPGETGLLGTVGERIFSSVEAIDGVIGVLGAEPTCKKSSVFSYKAYFQLLLWGKKVSRVH